MTWLWSRRGRFTLGAVGLVLTIAPIVGAQVLVDRFTHERAHVETAALAADFLSLSVNAIASGVNAVNHLVLDGISGCDPHALSTMQRVTATSVPVKAVAMIDADGSVRCNQFGGTDAIEPLSLMQPLADGTTSLGLVRLKSTDGKAVMVLRARPDGSRVAAFVASDALAIGNLPRVLRGSMVGALELANGVSLAGFGPSPTEAAEHDPVSAVATSLRFRFPCVCRRPTASTRSGMPTCCSTFGCAAGSSARCSLRCWSTCSKARRWKSPGCARPPRAASSCPITSR